MNIPTVPDPAEGMSERLAEAMELIRAQARPEALQALARFAIWGEGRLGLSVPQMRAVAKRLGRDHALALALWDTAVPDAQIVASLIAEPAQLTLAQMDLWTQGMAAWDVCDQACNNAFRKSPLAWARIRVWAASREEFVRRAGYALLAVMAVHDQKRPDADFIAMLALIEAAADDDRNFVKKAVNWALRQIGKRSDTLLPEAIACAERLRERPEKSACWIGADALRELGPRVHRPGRS
ncbi:DNA alkylation repair protein [Paucibacter sp. PLA-PC-4]|uniref:DNA alkylation repair protein n=1 Tax=Paucibacter sp. PLA-PC-4 TaxID=2993655 RepID=UPI00224926DD|nr:DNA alkylation repair protein [Paucibacter sp. PLA-PC-4]MCX2862427.1 DNA alkylation repair protein [Paucibacter sp. PLA-PC-4]